MKKILILASLLLLSCSEILDDCLLFPSKADIKTNEIADGEIDEEYYQVIKGDVKNKWGGDYSYSYEVNNLPDGLTYSESGSKLYIKGIPIESGSFVIEVSLTIDEECYSDFDTDEFDCDNICFANDTDSKKYSIKIKG